MKTKQRILNIDDIKLLVDSFYAKIRAEKMAEMFEYKIKY